MAIAKKTLKQSRAFMLGAAIATALLIAPGVAPAQSTGTGPAVLFPSLTSFSSTADRMISYRQEQHSWQTPDGAFHLMINRGDQPGDDALQLYSSVDGGASWLTGPSLAGSNQYSTQDGMLRGKTLALVYSSDNQAVEYNSYVWDPASATWTGGDVQTVYSAAGQQAINPCIGRDDNGNLWVPLVVTDLTTHNNSIRLMARLFGSSGWTDTGLVFGAVDGPTIERSAVPIPIPNGMGMVYTVHNNMYWATRDNLAAPTAPWTSQLLYTYTGPHTDPFSSHFSLVNDNRGNVHLALVDGGRLLYLRYSATDQTWKQRWMTSDVDAGYPQVSMVSTTLMIAVNSKSNVGVFTSTDLGSTFTHSFSLRHGNTGPGISYRYPRLETAATFTGPMLLFQQYTDNGVDRLLQYLVPIGSANPSSK